MCSALSDRATASSRPSEENVTLATSNDAAFEIDVLSVTFATERFELRATSYNLSGCRLFSPDVIKT